ncbi:hypothetical protein EAH89_10935 [Roseomonas nepalensis]|uniref:Uncharacterized protein n=1 Tax=Muricoccus nepalensis TaxID=1854500 RepID=A0A502G6H0_9PROT|nr:hypothetical protein EAH89_10935 [Roseomonas nepalensis]
MTWISVWCRVERVATMEPCCCDLSGTLPVSSWPILAIFEIAKDLVLEIEQAFSVLHNNSPFLQVMEQGVDCCVT